MARYGGRTAVTDERSWVRRHALLSVGLLAAVVLVAGFTVVQMAVRDRVGASVKAAGVALQWQTRAQARATLAERLAPAVAAVRLTTARAGPFDLSLGQLGVAVDTTQTAEAAWQRGRHRLPAGVQIWLPGGGGDLVPRVTVDAGVFERGLEAVRAQVDVPATDARLRLAGDAVAVVPSRAGSEVDAVALEHAIVAAVGRGVAFVGPVPMKRVMPQVSTADAESRAGAAAAYLARPLSLRYRSRQVDLSPAQMASMLSVNTGADAATYPLTFRNDRARAELHRIFAFAETKPVNATITVYPQGGIRVTQSEEGEVLDMPVLLQDLDAAAAGGGLRSVFVALKPQMPSLTTDDVQSMGLASLGSQFVTYFDPRNTTRSGNIALAAKIVDGTVVSPGQTFSLNAALGPRTVNRGFDYAPVITSDNVLRQGVGGGICQYATTLFNAVFFAGLPVVERVAHSLYISHYPIGRDATVSWGGADFKFRNDTGRSLMIRSWVEGDHVTVAIVGKTDRTVQDTTGPFYDIRKPAHGRSDPRVIYDSDLGPGVVRWERGIDGRSVKVERTVRDASGAVLFHDTFVSHYEPLDWVKRVGT